MAGEDEEGHARGCARDFHQHTNTAHHYYMGTFEWVMGTFTGLFIMTSTNSMRYASLLLLLMLLFMVSVLC